MKKIQSLFDACVKDKDGKTVIMQSPNIPIIVWVVATLVSKIIDAGRGHSFFSLIGFGALFTWAWLEIFSGRSYFRRGLGIVVMVWALYSRIY